MPLTSIICCLKEIQEIKFYLRIGSGYSKGSYYGTTLQPLQGLRKGNKEEPALGSLIIFIMILYLKEKGYGVEIKTTIIGDNFKLVNMIFVDNGDFKILGKRKDI